MCKNNIKRNFERITIRRLLLESKRYIEAGYRIISVEKEGELYTEVIYKFTGEDSKDIYIEQRYFAHVGKNEKTIKEKEKEGYVLCLDEWYDEESNVYIMGKEKEIFLDKKVL